MKRRTIEMFAFLIAASVPFGAFAASQTGGAPSISDRVTTLEDSVTNLQSSLTSLQTTLTTLQTTVVNVQSSNTTLQNALDAETQARKDSDSALQSLIAAGLGGKVFAVKPANASANSPGAIVAELPLPAGHFLAIVKANVRTFGLQIPGAVFTCDLVSIDASNGVIQVPYLDSVTTSTDAIDPVTFNDVGNTGNAAIALARVFTLTAPSILALACDSTAVAGASVNDIALIALQVQ